MEKTTALKNQADSIKKASYNEDKQLEEFVRQIKEEEATEFRQLNFLDDLKYNAQGK